MASGADSVVAPLDSAQLLEGRSYLVLLLPVSAHCQWARLRNLSVLLIVMPRTMRRKKKRKVMAMPQAKRSAHFPPRQTRRSD